MATPKRTNLIRECGLDQKAASLIIGAGITNSFDVATTLNNDPEAKEKLAGRKVLKADVDRFKESLEQQSSLSVAALVSKSPDAALQVAMVHERLGVLMDVVQDAETVAKGLYSRYASKLENDPEWLPGKEDATGLNAAAKQIELLLKAVSAFKQDQAIQTFIKNGTFVNNQGYSMDEMFDLVLGTALELGHTREEAMSAFARARAKLKAQAATHDIQRVV